MHDTIQNSYFTRTTCQSSRSVHFAESREPDCSLNQATVWQQQPCTIQEECSPAALVLNRCPKARIERTRDAPLSRACWGGRISIRELSGLHDSCVRVTESLHVSENRTDCGLRSLHNGQIVPQNTGQLQSRASMSSAESRHCFCLRRLFLPIQQAAALELRVIQRVVPKLFSHWLQSLPGILSEYSQAMLGLQIPCSA